MCPIRKLLYQLDMDYGHYLYWAMIAALPAALLWVLFSWVL
ncbi:inorganic phosphate transporter [Streptomyces albipurpureus]|uniref:Inorganic phosphate transporter n=1 Tax=Streptomyces albipurpureus TaxID=2897419 RepID=A0ABT0UPQ4_9ACTN|nr:inorganic phosphate transporter [Streptomyces sp. CWNU-1]MCM2390332.1 inorganic phosphate transporter [Streptomyces sp. CWNU-1]